jgi:hypothetical protein
MGASHSGGRSKEDDDTGQYHGQYHGQFINVNGEEDASTNKEQELSWPASYDSHTKHRKCARRSEELDS